MRLPGDLSHRPLSPRKNPSVFMAGPTMPQHRGKTIPFFLSMNVNDGGTVNRAEI